MYYLLSLLKELLVIFEAFVWELIICDGNGQRPDNQKPYGKSTQHMS